MASKHNMTLIFEQINIELLNFSLISGHLRERGEGGGGGEPPGRLPQIYFLNVYDGMDLLFFKMMVVTTPVGLSMYNSLIQKCTSNPIKYVCTQSQPAPNPRLGIATAKCTRKVKRNPYFNF